MDPSKKIILIFRAPLHQNHKKIFLFVIRQAGII